MQKRQFTKVSLATAKLKPAGCTPAPGDATDKPPC